MFVQSAEFIAAHRDDLAAQGKAQDSIYVYGQEKTLETVKLAKMNLAVNGLPRNKTKLKKSEAGLETVPNANYLWINLFATSLKPQGRAALVMANSASDARHSEAGFSLVNREANQAAFRCDTRGAGAAASSALARCTCSA